MLTTIDLKKAHIPHEAFFKNGLQTGFGTVIIFQTGAALHFKATLNIEQHDSHRFKIYESAVIQEIEESWNTIFEINFIDRENFSIELINDTLGLLKGEGLASRSYISWKMYDSTGKVVGNTHFTLLEDRTYLVNSTYKLFQSTQVSISGLIKQLL